MNPHPLHTFLSTTILDHGFASTEDEADATANSILRRLDNRGYTLEQRKERVMKMLPKLARSKK